MFEIVKRIFSLDEDPQTGDENQLWIMIQEDDYFRDEEHFQLIDEMTEITEEAELGELDGHSSGAYQLEVNFFGVLDYEKAKDLISNYIESTHPDLVFTIAKEYKSIYEKVSRC
jgi:hypothetical protein